MNSDKKNLLPSYMNYEELRIRKEKAENNISSLKIKFGTLKSIVFTRVCGRNRLVSLSMNPIWRKPKNINRGSKTKTIF